MYPEYPQMKESSIEWLGKYPAEWGIKRFRFCSSISNEVNGNEPIGVMLSVSGYNGVVPKEYEYEERKRLPEDLETYRVVRPGQLVVNTMWLNYAGLGVSEHEGHVSPAYRSYWLSEELDKHYLHHLMRSSIYVGRYCSLLRGIRPNSYQVSTDDFRSIEILVPPLPEQVTIASFLDRKTTLIDDLIAKQERQIELLQEQRTALISQAVTKGLNPDVPMKDRGVEWIGDIPTKWNVSPIKRFVSIPVTDGPHETPEFLDEGVPFVSAEAVWGGKVHMSSMRGFISPEAHKKYSQKYLPRKDDIFMVKSGATTGKVAIVDYEDEFNVWSPLAAIRCDKRKAIPKFVLYALGSEYFQGLVQVSWSFGTQQNIGMGVIENLRVLLPPIIEQQAISTFLDRETSKIDTFVSKVQQSVEKLREYRQSLISAAVTGKIDVRNWQSSSEPAEETLHA